MKICGLQKTTLLDFPEKMACTIFTGGCNFACPFCHNGSLVVGPDFKEVISEVDFLAFLKKRQGILDGVCITGGEPLIQKNLEDLIYKIKAAGFLVKLDTNGSFPEQLSSLVKEKLVDYVAMDIKNSPANYGKSVGILDIDISPIKESVAFLMEKKVDFEFRTTAVNGIHTLSDFAAIAKWLKGDEKYFLQNFIDSGDTISARINSRQTLTGFSRSQMVAFYELIKQYIPQVQIRGF